MEIKKDNSMLIDVQYVDGRGKDSTDYLYVIWKDLDNNEKKLMAIPEPKMTIYFEKPEYRNHSYNTTYAKIETLDAVTVRNKHKIYAIANDMGDVGKQKLQNCYNTGDYKQLKEFYMYPYVFGADYDIRVWYRHRWLLSNDNNRVKNLTKGFLDIEVDTMEADGLPNPIYNPIDLVTLIDTSTNISYTFALVGVDCPDNDMKNIQKQELYEYRLKQQKYWSSNINDLDDKAHEMFDENYPEMEYKFYFYSDEAKMLVHLFELINSLKLDIIGVWNISFDIPYIIERLKVLGLDPKQVMCHRDFPVKECYFKKDTHNFAIKNKSDFFHVSSYTIFVDQMIIYAAIRKGQSELRSYKLNYIAEKEIGDTKLDYSETANIKTLSYKNYLMYVLYNIKDVLLQTKIESRTTDMDTFYLTSYKNITPYENVFKQTVKLRNVQYKSFWSQGLVPGENVNGILYNFEKDNRKDNEEDEEDDDSFEGALVGNPLLNDNFGEELFGVKSNAIFAYSIDFDMGAFYPSTIRVNNIDPSTLIFKMIVDSGQYDVRGGKIPFNGITDIQLVKTNTDSFSGDISKEIMDNFQTGNYLVTGNKWMNLPNVQSVYKRLKKELG